jgi:hypothetical protein
VLALKGVPNQSDLLPIVGLRSKSCDRHVLWVGEEDAIIVAYVHCNGAVL